MNHSHHGDHHHDHHQHHAHVHNSSAKRLWQAMLFTFVFALVEIIAGYFTHSLALISDGGHMIADSLTLVMAAVAAWVAARPPSARHSYGLGRIEVITALGSSLIIIAVVIGIAVEAVNRLQHPEPIAGGIVIIIATLGLIVNLCIALLLSHGEETFNTRAALLHVIGDLLGSIAAIIAGAVIYKTHWLPIDSILSLFISVLILISSLRLLRDTFGVLMEGVPTHLQLATVGKAMAVIDGVKNIHDLHIWTLSSGMIVLSAHVEIEDWQAWENTYEHLHDMLTHEFKIQHITLQPEINKHALAHAKTHCESFTRDEDK